MYCDPLIYKLNNVTQNTRSEQIVTEIETFYSLFTIVWKFFNAMRYYACWVILLLNFALKNILHICINIH
jgi:hypothetical protein